MNRTSWALIAIGFIFGCGLSTLLHCKMDITSVVVAIVTACPILFGQWLNYNLSKSNRELIWNMHGENTKKLEEINSEVKSNGH